MSSGRGREMREREKKKKGSTDKNMEFKRSKKEPNIPTNLTLRYK